MHFMDFQNLKLKYGDYVWILKEDGQGFWGYFEDHYTPRMETFKFTCKWS